MAAAEGEGEAAAAEGDEEALRRLEELVSDLYRFRDRLRKGKGDDPGSGDASTGNGVAGTGIGDASTGSGHASTGSASPGSHDRAEAALAQEMEKTLKLMEEIQVSPSGRGRAWSLRGRALGVLPSGHARAELALGHALKLEPQTGLYWRQLGELRWGRGDLQGAKACLETALRQGEDPAARRLLSMVLRAGGAQAAALRQSLAQAEAAVRSQPGDGSNWYVLGNSYVALFFAMGQSQEWAQRALGAYRQAERIDPEAANNPDLHLNRATLLQYQERFGEALEGLGRAWALAPDWEEPRERLRNLEQFLTQLCHLLDNRGKHRGKRRRALEAPLPPALLGPLQPLPLPRLQPGANRGQALAGRVLFTLLPPGGVPYTLGVSDGAGGVAAVTVYNAAPDWSVLVGDALGVPEPQLLLHQHHYQGKTFSFTGIRVSSPLSLLVNGRRPPASALAPARLALHNPPSPDQCSQ